MRDVIRAELVTVTTQLDSLAKGQDKLSKVVEMQGGNIESLTEMLDEFGSRLAEVESLGSATNQRLARMRARYQQIQTTRPPAPGDQASELSQDDFQDASQEAQTYDPSYPSDYTENRTGAQQHTGLESPATAMRP
jgi:chromosome segregation ATPase